MKLNAKYAQAMGIISSRVLVPFVLNSTQYKAMDDAQKGLVLDEVLKEVRSNVREYVNEGLPLDEQVKLEIKKLSPRLRLLLRKRGVTE